MENDNFNIDYVIMLIMQRDHVEVYLVPKARAFVDWKEYHAHRAANNSDLDSDLRMMFFDDKDGPGHAFAVRYAEFRIGSAPLGGGLPMSRQPTRPSPIAGPSHQSPIQIVITQPDQRGHADTRMTEKHYAHLSPSYVADTIRAHFPTLGIGGSTAITPIRRRK
jgi:hypothetical protein